MLEHPATWCSTSCRVKTVEVAAIVEAVSRSAETQCCRQLQETRLVTAGATMMLEGVVRWHVKWSGFVLITHRLCASRRLTRFAPWNTFRFSAHPDVQTNE